MKIKNKLLIFLGIFIFMIIPKNVSAKEVIPYISKVNNVIYSDNGRTTGSYTSGNISYQQYIDLNIVVTTIYNTWQQTFTDYPYVAIYFQTSLAQDKIFISRPNSCTTSCFKGTGIQLSKIGVSPVTNRNIYVLVLPVGKYYSHNAVGNWETIPDEVADTIRITNNNNNSNTYFMSFTDVVLLDENSFTNNDYQNYNSVINNATTNANNIINNQNNNTQSIINNQTQNATQAHNDSQELNNTMKDESGVSNNDVSNKTTEWSSKLAGTGPVSQMVLMPITLLNGYVNGMNATCTPYNLGNLMGTDIILPCINISNYLGSSLWGVIDVLFSGFMIFVIGKKFVKIFNDFTNLRDNQMDELYGGGK